MTVNTIVPPPPPEPIYDEMNQEMQDQMQMEQRQVPYHLSTIKSHKRAFPLLISGEGCEANLTITPRNLDSNHDFLTHHSAISRALRRNPTV